MTQQENRNLELKELDVNNNSLRLIDFENLRTDVSQPSDNEDNSSITVGSIAWFQYAANEPLETNVEIQEKQQAIREQVELKILKVTADGKALIVNDDSLNPPTSEPTNIQVSTYTPRKLILKPIKKPKPNDKCPCGSGRKYKKCCSRK